MMRGNTRLSSGASECIHRSGEPAPFLKEAGSPTRNSGMPILVIRLESRRMLRQRNICLAHALPDRAVERCLSQAATPSRYPVS